MIMWSACFLYSLTLWDVQIEKINRNTDFHDVNHIFMIVTFLHCDASCHNVLYPQWLMNLHKETIFIVASPILEMNQPDF